MINAINLMIGKTLAEREGLSKDRALQLGLVAAVMPGMQGIMLVALLARREPTPAKTYTVGPPRLASG